MLVNPNLFIRANNCCKIILFTSDARSKGGDSPGIRPPFLLASDVNRIILLTTIIRKNKYIWVYNILLWDNFRMPCYEACEHITWKIAGVSVRDEHERLTAGQKKVIDAAAVKSRGRYFAPSEARWDDVTFYTIWFFTLFEMSRTDLYSSIIYQVLYFSIWIDLLYIRIHISRLVLIYYISGFIFLDLN